MSQALLEAGRRQKALLEEKKDLVEEAAAKRPRLLESVVKSPAAKALAAPDTARSEQHGAAAAPDTPKKEQDDAPAAPDAASHGRLSQETLRMGGGSPVVEDSDEA